MELYLKRILKTILLTALLFGIIAYSQKTKHQLSWEQVLTIKFWLLTVLHLIPSYFVVWSFESHYESWMEGNIMLFIIMVLWLIVLTILCVISHFVFHYDLINLKI